MNLKTDLLEYQKDAVSKILPTRIGALFMEMGTGKSRTAIELAYLRKNKIDKVIWFCPVSLKETVRQEIKKHTNYTDIYVFDNKTNPNNIPKCFWYVVGIESMSSSNRIILTVSKIITENTFVILDESSYIKGHKALRTFRVTELCKNTRYRLILNGTPISQGIVDLFAQFKFLSPKILGYNSFYSFAANHLEYSEKYPGMIIRAHNTEFIAAKIKPYTYQVTKEECLNLPSKLHETSYFSMSDEQRYYYELAKEDFFQKTLEDETIDSYALFQLFNRLQCIISGFWNDNGKLLEFENNRVDQAISVIERIPKAEKIIIFCKYEYDLKNLQKRLTDSFGDVSIFYGKLNEKQRNAQLNKFRQSARFFITTQSCGGHGLTLNEANHVIFYNNTFKYSERLQAEDRCHRIGQAKPVTYIDIHCVDSIDDRISESLSKKGNLVEDFKKQVDKVKKEGIKELIKSL